MGGWIDTLPGRIGLLALFTAAAVVVALPFTGDDTPARACAGVSLDGPPASTREEAFTAFVEQRGGDPSDWHPTDDGGFEADNRLDNPVGLESLVVQEVRPATWQVTGGCA